jgi:hypothetical protein
LPARRVRQAREPATWNACKELAGSSYAPKIPRNWLCIPGSPAEGPASSAILTLPWHTICSFPQAGDRNRMWPGLDPNIRRDLATFRELVSLRYQSPTKEWPLVYVEERHALLVVREWPDGSITAYHAETLP